MGAKWRDVLQGKNKDVSSNLADCLDLFFRSKYMHKIFVELKIERKTMQRTTK